MYKVVIVGLDRNSGYDDARARLATLFKTSPDKIDRLLAEPGYVVKRGLSAEGAKRYKVAIEQAGAECRIDSDEIDSLEVDLPKEPTAVAQTSSEIGQARNIRIVTGKEEQSFIDAAETADSEFESAQTTNLPAFKLGSLLGDGPYGNYHFRFFRSKSSNNETSLINLYMHFRYRDGYSKYIKFNTAHLDGGQALDLISINTEATEHGWTETLSVNIPDEIAWERLNVGFKVRISRPDMGRQFVVDIPSAYVRATLALRHPELLDRKGLVKPQGSGKEVDSPHAAPARKLSLIHKIGLFILLPILATTIALDKFSEPKIAQSPTQLPVAERSAEASDIQLSQEALALIPQIKAKAINRDVMGSVSMVGMGVDIAPNVEFKYYTNRFGEEPSCVVSFLATDIKSGETAIPKWGLVLANFSEKGIQFVASESFFGPGNAIRLAFNPPSLGRLELNEQSNGDVMSLRMDKAVRDRFIQAKSVELNHGMVGSDRIAYSVELAGFPLAVQLSNTLCPDKK